MRQLLILAVLALPTLLTAQGQSGRHFHRTPRAPVTAPASSAVDASSGTTSHRVEPLRRLRSGRAWSLYHYSRRPITPATGTPVVEASATKEVRRTTFWGRRLRHGTR